MSRNKKKKFLNMIIPIKQHFSEYNSIKLIKMGNVKELNIKNQTYCFFDDIINIKNFHSNLLKIEKSRMKTLIFTILITSRLGSLVILKIFIA